MRLRELHIEYRPHPSGATIDGRAVATPRAAAAVLHQMLESCAEERAIALLLNTKHRIIAAHEVGRGGLTSVVIEPRIVIRAALLANATAIVLAHNHPSGDPTPSPDDVGCTRRVAAACELMGITLLDHLIIGDGRYISLQEMGIL